MCVCVCVFVCVCVCVCACVFVCMCVLHAWMDGSSVPPLFRSYKFHTLCNELLITFILPWQDLATFGTQKPWRAKMHYIGC